ncbi:ribose-phosphate diphosphokinase [Halomonas campisalis]|uniref:Ribose-phosphate diphosphokinase n=1 Tax=Billgrantia campisalis TaxID=74661 RepID=A0ABS9PBU3_9GAMM|nr:ribose-phosphate diphosphokinase [Halomonas campisalis]MCG6659237.1 ribose-phosphate diphosphokinase [Halomonas campisalis]MDR5864236.1 ribose-phosphate diphosphokinase [Halomonas campisalis]
MSPVVLYFEDEATAAQRLAAAAGLAARSVARHRFPDAELKLTLPFAEASDVPGTLVIYRSLDRPNDKLIELLLLARHARGQGVAQLVLVAPYLAYMRQDIAFCPGEIVSQTIVGGFLAELFDAVITVDPHLHRIERLDQAIPIDHAIALSGAPRLAELIAEKRESPLLLGPDEEALQWVAQAAELTGFDHGTCRKTRHGDRDVAIALPEFEVAGRQVVLMDDVASSGHTVARAAEALLAAGAESVDVALTHALFAEGAVEVIRAAGVGEVWSTDCIAHPSNAIPMAPLLAASLAPLLREWR